MRKNGLLIAILFLVIGFAAVSTTLYINGTVLIAGDQNEFDVYYSNAYINGVENKGVITSDKTISFNKEFKTVNETYILKYDITNGSKNYNADVSINCSDGNDYISVVNSWIDNTIINATETKSVTLPSTLTEIGINCFTSTGLTSVTIPGSVSIISNRAFAGASTLTSVNIMEGVEVIDEYAFGGTGLTSVSIPNSVTSIGESAFSDCTSLSDLNVPSTVKTIGTDAFYNVPHITYNGIATDSPWGALSIN